jgi:PAS domain S-box-containing protein
MFIDQKRFQLSWSKQIGLTILVFLLFVLLGKLGMFFTAYNHSSTPLWPPSGFSLALVLLFGFRQVFPSIILGVLFLALRDSNPGIVILGLIAAQIVEVFLASTLLLANGKGKFKFISPLDILSFVLIAVILAPFVSSTVAVTFLYIGDMIEVSTIKDVWNNFFMGNSLGILIFAPLTISFMTNNERKINYVEVFCLLLLVGFLSYWAFDGYSFRKFTIIPVLTWAALRFSFRGVSIATLILGIGAFWRATYLESVFVKNSYEADLLWIQCAIAFSAISGYFMSTVSEAQEVAHEKDLELSINLQHKRIAEEALAILDQSIHKSPIGFALIDKDLKYIRVNKAMAKLNGVSSDVHLGRTLNEMSLQMSLVVEPFVGKVFETGTSIMNIPYRGLSTDGVSSLAGLLSYYPVRHPISDEIFGVAVSFQDMTDQLHIQNLLRENQDRLAFAQEAGKIGAFEWDKFSERVLWTTELEGIYGLASGEFDGKYQTWIQYIHPEDLESVVAESLRVIRSGSELNFEFRIITKTNAIRWVLARGKMVKDNHGNDVKFIGINIDLTEQKSIEQKLRETETNLLHALSVRDEFMAIASHELKTPLQSLKLQIQLHERSILRENPEAFSRDKIIHLLHRNSSQIDRLTRLVDDMLDISRIRTGKLSIKKESCDLNSMLMDILGRTREQFEASGSGQPIIEHSEMALGEWDPMRIDQVILNIITNAIRYGLGKPISISIKNHQESVRLTVTDQGLGIAKADHQKIFERYERGLLDREVSGLGLGLFISKQIVAAHGGTIRVESEIGHGSTFIVDLPRTSLPIILPKTNETFALA